MNREIPKTKATRLINPGGVILVTSCYKDKTNIITLAWHTPISKDPALLGIAIAKSHLSYDLIKKSEEFIINIPSFDLLKQTVLCGSVSGENVDKFKEARLTPKKADKLIKTPCIKECIGHIECYLRDIKDIGDHGLFIGEIIFASAKEGLFDDIWQVDKTKLIFHLGGKFFTGSSQVTMV
ncbi:MAG: flavin reductase family protein [Candidatus Omnitrophica bacterium]|nr:flavin reductase family protein [Candidatus Omnitrophota bacterium]